MSEQETGVVRIRVSVEPRGSVHALVDIIEVDAAELEGLSPEERDAVLQKIAEEAANELAPWGWAELAGEHDLEDEA
jgi:hypothetical protein